MTTITDSHKDDFRHGFVTAMLWSTGGQPDYAFLPEGYDVKQLVNGEWLFVEPNGSEWGDGYTHELAASAAAWRHAKAAPPECDDLLDYDLADETREAVRQHCASWITENAALLALYAENIGPTNDGSTAWERAGRDFWLTSVGHGVGFWDRGLGELGDQLTTACKQFEHEHDAYIGDDGLIYVSGMETAQ